jgi:glycosyltransferase involved in cell wall biosynthesis
VNANAEGKNANNGVFIGKRKPRSCSVIGLILPTYCEAADIEKSVEEIERLNLNMSILVINDSSPWGTADAVRRLQKKYKNILLFVRPKKTGLGTAITDGSKAFLSMKIPRIV